MNLRERSTSSSIVSRREAGHTDLLTVKALDPLLRYLRGLGVAPLASPPVCAGPVEELLSHFRRYLEQERAWSRRPPAAMSTSSARSWRTSMLPTDWSSGGSTRLRCAGSWARLYGPDDGKTFEGVIGKDLSNSMPEWAEHGAERKVVPYPVVTDMDSPNPDSGEEWYHTNTQLFNTIDEHNRFKIGEAVTAPYNVPLAGAKPTMEGFVTDYISTFTGEVGRQPTYEEYAGLHP